MTPFRRSADWWETMSPEPRDASISEVAQLTRLAVLTEVERRILNGDATADDCGSGSEDRRHWLMHLNEDERVLLGFPSPLEAFASAAEVFQVGQNQRRDFV